MSKIGKYLKNYLEIKSIGVADCESLMCIVILHEHFSGKIDRFLWFFTLTVMKSKVFKGRKTREEFLLFGKLSWHLWSSSAGVNYKSILWAAREFCFLQIRKNALKFGIFFPQIHTDLNVKDFLFSALNQVKLKSFWHDHNLLYFAFAFFESVLFEKENTE